jgi:hypothetical protein
MNPVEADREILPGFLEIYHQSVSPELLPHFYRTADSRFNGDYDAFTGHIYNSSIFADTSLLFRAIRKGPQNAIRKVTADPLYQLYLDFQRTLAEKINLRLYGLLPQQDKLYRKYTEGMMKMDSDGVFYHDANSTMRLTYGKVEGYKPSDAVTYDYYTTLEGVKEKEDLQLRITRCRKTKELYHSGDLGSLLLRAKCRFALQHPTTLRSNSGSPVINAKGELIALTLTGTGKVQ